MKVKFLKTPANWNPILDTTFSGEVTKKEKKGQSTAEKAILRKTKRCT